MNNIYYIEDIKNHFDSLSLLLNDNGYNVCPSSENWDNEIKIFIEFINEQSNIDKKEKLRQLFFNYKPDLIIIDVDLGVNYSGDGEDIYRNFILKSEDFRSIPVIYLTKVGKSSITLYNKTRHVPKVLKKLGELDTDEIKTELLEKILELLKPSSGKGFWDKVIDSI